MDADVIAVIPARGGSKRIPRKNVRQFNGQPIIKYSIDAAMAAGIFSEVMVSTDDVEIADVAASCGARVPFMRSAERSTDVATTADVLAEVVNDYGKRGRRFPYLCCIYPTAPFVTAEKLLRGWGLIRNGDLDAVISVCRFANQIWRSLKIEDDRLAFNWPQYANERSQDLPTAYYDCGQIYFLRTDALVREGRVFLNRSAPLLMPATEVQDIDDEDDWVIAEMKYVRMRQSLTSLG